MHRLSVETAVTDDCYFFGMLRRFVALETIQNNLRLSIDTRENVSMYMVKKLSVWW
jgi:hypothetical protein